MFAFRQTSMYDFQKIVMHDFREEEGPRGPSSSRKNLKIVIILWACFTQPLTDE